MTSDNQTPIAPSAAVTAAACLMATIDGRRGDLTLMLADLNRSQLRAVIGELLDSWMLAARYAGGDRADLRAAVAADALDLAKRARP